MEGRTAWNKRLFKFLLTTAQSENGSVNDDCVPAVGQGPMWHSHYQGT